MPIFFTAIMLFALVIFVVALVIGGWLVVTIFRGIASFFVGWPKPAPRRNVIARQRSVLQCDRPQCRSDNPGHAQFCRKCGERLKAAQVRQVA